MMPELRIPGRRIAQRKRTILHLKMKNNCNIVECSNNTHQGAPPPRTSNRHHLSYDDCLENKGRLHDCSCSIGSYHCIQCYAHIMSSSYRSNRFVFVSLGSLHCAQMHMCFCVLLYFTACMLYYCNTVGWAWWD